MIQYYTLEEAAQLLQMAPDKLKEKVKKNEIRAFQDRGTLRFRKQEVDELVRSTGLGSGPDLPLGEAPKPSGGGAPSSARRRAKSATDAGTFNFADDDSVPLAGPPSGTKKSSPSSGSKGRTPGPKTPGPRSPAPKPGSDSDVRLVSDGSDLDFHLEADEIKPSAPKSGSKKDFKSPPSAASDSNVPILPPDLSSDSDVKIEPDHGAESVVPIGQQGAKSPSDSDIRLEGDPLAGLSGGKKQDSMITEEIDLDAEAAKIEDARKKAKGKKVGDTSGSQPALPTSSPFELSDNDLDMGMDENGKGSKGPGVDSSGDFVLTASDDSSVIMPGSDEMPPLQEEEVTLGELTGGSGASGINIQEPADSGISLEGSEDEIEFDLSADAGSSAAPKSHKTPTGGVESSSDFELSLSDDDDSANQPPDSDSEFELTLDEDGSSSESESESGSDSEFELTLDEDGGLAPADDSSESSVGEDGKDIFETDFDVPALEDESGSDAVDLEESTDLESSDFELEVGEEEPTADESGGEFDVEAEEDEAFAEEDEEAAPTPKRKTKGGRQAVAEEESGLDLSLDTDEEDEEEEVMEEEEELVGAGAAPAAAAAPTEWGILPALALMPCLIILIIAGLMSFELIQGSWGFHKPATVPNLIIDPIARMFDESLPKE